MRLLKSIALVASMALFANMDFAQNGYMEAVLQNMATLPGRPSNIFLVDGQVYCKSKGLMLWAKRTARQLIALVPDTHLVQIDRDISYATRNPANGHLFFTTDESRQRSFLYEQVPREGRQPKTNRIRFDEFRDVIHHPTFSSDGKIMVFASNERQTFGGMDLWCSFFNGQEWTEPVNMGRNVNSSGDEMAPFIFGDYLFFASLNRSPADSGWFIYATRLVSTLPAGDTVAMRSIGRSKVQRLPWPVNCGEGDKDMLVDTVKGCCYWFSAKDHRARIAFSPSLPEAVALQGIVTDASGLPLVDVVVSVFNDDVFVAEALTDSGGRFCLFLAPGDQCRLSFQKEGFYVSSRIVSIAKQCEDLICQVDCNASLYGLPLGQPIDCDGIFGDNADIELPPEAKDAFDPFVAFFRDNPSLSMTLRLTSDRTSNAHFNRMLTGRRLSALQNYFSLLFPGRVISYVNACADGQCASNSGQTSLTIEFN